LLVDLKLESILSSITAAFQARAVWLWLAQQDIRARYRGSLLGPIWLVFNLASVTVGLSIVYGAVFSLPLASYIPYLSAGFLVWWFISGTLNDSCQAFIDNHRLIRNQPLPLAVYVFRVIARNGLLFAHNFLVFLVAALIFRVVPTMNTLLVFPGTLLLLCIILSMSIILSILCVRFRDVPHVVSNVLQLIMLITPIVFMKDQLQSRAVLADWNPFYHMLEVIRQPLLGHAPSASTWLFLLSMNLIFGLLAYVMLKRWGNRIPCMV
jgi:ABC-2 type transport system permease protein